MKNSKLKVGIEIDEVLRAKWLQFDRFYVQEFGEEDIPEQPYVFDLFSGYPWKDKTEVVKDLKEPEDIPEDINPLDYQVDKKTGEANADFVLFKAPEKIHLTAKEVYNRFMYEDFVFEIHGSAPIMYKGLDLHVKNFYEKYKDTVDFIVFSKENEFSIPSTLFFLSKMICRFPNYHFILNNQDIHEIWNHVDVVITTNPELLNNEIPYDTHEIPSGNTINIVHGINNKHVIKLTRPYNNDNKDSKGSITPVLQINDLFENPEFEKIINYIKPKVK